MIIAICGNIGAGKSTLSKALSEKFKAKLYEEPVDENPYLVEFYKNPTRFGIGMEIHLLINRLREFKKASNLDENNKQVTAITDRIFYENRVFAEALLQHKIYRDIEYKTYLDIEIELKGEPDNIENVIPVYLKTDTEVLMNRIKNRGRECEKGIDNIYIEQLNKNYNKMFDTLDCIVVDNNRNRLNDYSFFVTEIEREIKKRLK